MNQDPDVATLVVALLRSAFWLGGIFVAVKYINQGIHASYINVVIMIGMALAAFNGIVLGMNTAHYPVAPWLVNVSVVMTLPQVVALVGGFVLRVLESVRIRQRVGEIDRAAADSGQRRRASDDSGMRRRASDRPCP